MYSWIYQSFMMAFGLWVRKIFLISRLWKNFPVEFLWFRFLHLYIWATWNLSWYEIGGRDPTFFFPKWIPRCPGNIYWIVPVTMGTRVLFHRLLNSHMSLDIFLDFYSILLQVFEFSNSSLFCHSISPSMNWEFCF